MTIDPEKFEPQGKPTREQVRAVWDAHAAPSARVIEALMVGRGFDISFRTIARWKAKGWGEASAPGTAPLAEKGQVRGVQKALKSEVAKIPPATVAEADKLAKGGGLDATLNGGVLTEADYDRINRRVRELALQSEAGLDLIEAKSRKIMNIVMMEEATRRAHVMVLIPKDTGHFIHSMTEASKVMLTGGDGQPPKPGDPSIIDVTPNPANPTSDAIKKFLRESEAA